MERGGDKLGGCVCVLVMRAGRSLMFSFAVERYLELA